MKALELARLKGELVPRDEVLHEFLKRIHVVKTDMLALPKRLARWPEAQEIAKKHVINMMKTYSRPSGVVK